MTRMGTGLKSARACLSTLVFVCGAQTASAQLLQIHGPTLTAFQGSANTPVQGVRPVVDQRGTGLDGNIREANPFGWAIAANPFYEDWNSNRSFESVKLDGGGFDATTVDLALPAPGFSWVIGTTYNGRQQTNPTTALISNGYQGNNRFQSSQPEIVLAPGATAAQDILYLVYGADRFVEFKRKGGAGADANLFIGVNGAAGGWSVQPDAAGADLWVYYDQTGLEVTFFSPVDTDIPSGKRGQLWRIARRGENAASTTDDFIAYIGDATNKATALTAGYDTDGRITKAYDTDGRRYDYTYAADAGGTLRLASVEVKRFISSAWSATGDKVEYTYYGALDPNGRVGDLKLIRVTRQTSDAARKAVYRTYYRYYTAPFDQGTNLGHPSLIKLVVGPEGCRAYDWGSEDGQTPGVLDESFMTVTAQLSSLKKYASAELEYWPNAVQRRVSAATFNGECGCAGGINGKYGFRYEDSVDRAARVANQLYDFNNDYAHTEQAWSTRTIIVPPEESAGVARAAFTVQYFDEVGQPLSRVEQDRCVGLNDCGVSPTLLRPVIGPDGTIQLREDPPKFWAFYIMRDLGGRIIARHWPANVETYIHSTASPANPGVEIPVGQFSTKSNDKLVRTYSRVATGDLAGFEDVQAFKLGSLATTTTAELRQLYGQSSYTPVPGLTIVRPWVSETRAYVGSAGPTQLNDPSLYNRTQYQWTMYTGQASLMAKQIKELPAIVSPQNNGSGLQDESRMLYRTDGTPVFGVAEDGIVTYWGYQGGLQRSTIEDANTTLASSFGTDTPSSYGVASTSGTPFHVRTLFDYEADGQLAKTTRYVGTAEEEQSRRFVTVLADGRVVTLAVPLVRTPNATAQYVGPVEYTVFNHAGKDEFLGLIDVAGGASTLPLASWIASSNADPKAALSTAAGVIGKLSTKIYSSAGLRLVESRVYHKLPTTLPGADRENYDVTVITYDNAGRKVRTVHPGGTIAGSQLDARGNVLDSTLGTSDGPSASDMRPVSRRGYDHGNPGQQVGGVDVPTQDCGPRASVPGSSGGTGNSQPSESDCLLQKDTRSMASSQRFANRDPRGRVLRAWGRGVPDAAGPNSWGSGYPVRVMTYDNLGRRTAMGVYEQPSGALDLCALVPETQDPLATHAKRRAATQFVYDERGRLCREVVHAVDQQSGAAASSEALSTNYFYDQSGRPVKISGKELRKIGYDRLGRVMQRFTLASDDDGGTYANVYDVATRTTRVNGDLVLIDERIGRTPQAGDVISTAVFSRFHKLYSDVPSLDWTGPLYSNQAATTVFELGNTGMLWGRPQITAMWYDDLHRLRTLATYGTNGGQLFDRASATEPAASSAAVLVTRTVYDGLGRVSLSIPPRGTASQVRTEYDLADRVTRTIEADSGTGAVAPSGATVDADRITRYVYGYPQDTSGHYVPGFIKKMIVVRPGSTNDQVTTYVYGTRLDDDQPATGHLLSKIIYPAATDSFETKELYTNNPTPPMLGGGSGPATRETLIFYNRSQKPQHIVDFYRFNTTSASPEVPPDPAEIAQVFNVGTVLRDIKIRYDASGREAVRFHPLSSSSGGLSDPWTDTTDAAPWISGYADHPSAILTEYDILGRITSVMQSKDYSDPTDNAILDEVRFEYDQWGNISKFHQDADSKVILGAAPQVGMPTRTMSYQYGKASGGRTTSRRTRMTYPDGWQLGYAYSTPIDDASSRVSLLVNPANQPFGPPPNNTYNWDIPLTSYAYLGESDVVMSKSEEPAAFRQHYESSAPTAYGRRDRFNRLLNDRWTRTTKSNIRPEVNFYSVDMSYDANSNPLTIDDQFMPGGFDMKVSVDKLDRVTRVERGTFTSGTMGSRKHDEQWTLGQTGNWVNHKLDLNDDGIITPVTGELDETNPDTGTSPALNTVNELRKRNPAGQSQKTLRYDYAGSLVDDGENYKYRYDIFGRLVQVTNRNTNALVARYRYNGLGYRIAWQYDAAGYNTRNGTEPDGLVDTSDPWFFFVHDEKWRAIATYRAVAAPPPAPGQPAPTQTNGLPVWTQDASPKERFVYHAAGRDGKGDSSYIDDIIFRDRDNPGTVNGWPVVSDGVLEERRYLFQNWRHDVVSVLGANGQQWENKRYSAYGVARNWIGGDLDGDGYTSAAEYTQISTWLSNGTYDVRGDVNLSGELEMDDLLVLTDYSSQGLSGGGLSHWKIGVRSGYAGYQWDHTTGAYHIRNRYYVPAAGRWLSRDPMGYHAGVNVYGYVTQQALRHIDALGLRGAPPMIGIPGPAASSPPTTGLEGLRWKERNPYRTYPSAKKPDGSEYYVPPRYIGPEPMDEVEIALDGAGQGVDMLTCCVNSMVIDPYNFWFQDGPPLPHIPLIFPDSPYARFQKICTIVCSVCLDAKDLWKHRKSIVEIGEGLLEEVKELLKKTYR